MVNLNKPIILVTCANTIAPAGFPAFSLNYNYASYVQRAGGIPYPVGLIELIDEYISVADGLLLTGGTDIAPEYYGQNIMCDNVRSDKQRDEFEFLLTRQFLQTGKPVFGICRGFQLLNVLLGGSLIQDIPAWCGANHGGGVLHEVMVTQKSTLLRTAGKKLIVNSYHHQAVTEDILAKGLCPTAFSKEDDGKLVEAFEHISYPMWGVQWHPERVHEDLRVECSAMDELLSFFISRCRETMPNNAEWSGEHRKNDMHSLL